MAYAFGQGGNVEVGPLGDSITVCVKEWSGNFDFGTQDLTTTCSEGWKDRYTGIKSCDLTFSGFYDPAAVPANTFLDGATLHMVFTLGQTGNDISGDFVVNTYKITNPATEYINFECSVYSQGIVALAET